MSDRESMSDHRPLLMLAQAVAGRPLPVTLLTQAEAACSTDGERIYLAAGLTAPERHLAVIAQAALIAGGALETSAMRAIVGDVDLRRRYLVLEVERCCLALADRLPRLLEARMAPYRTGQVPRDAGDSLKLAKGRAALPAPPGWYGTLQPWRVLRKRLFTHGAPLTQSRLAQMEAKLREIESGADDDADDSLRKTSFWKFLSSPFGRDNFISRFMQDILDMKSSPDKDAADSGLEGSSELVSGRISNFVRDITQAVRSARDVAIAESLVRANLDTHAYPEWDHGAGRYRPAWTSVQSVDPGPGPQQMSDMRLEAGSDRAFQRALAGLCLGFQWQRGQAQGDELVVDPMVRLAVDLRTGHSGSDRIYAALLRTRRDLGVQILLDVSSSTLERSGQGERVFDLQASAAWKLCRAFATLGDRVALDGFHSWGRSLVRFQRIKGFDEAFGGQCEHRLRRVSVAGYTRCGAAIRHATAQIEAHAGTPHKLLLLISDGYPYDDQYEGQYAIEDTRKAIGEAQEKGVAVVCLSVGGDADAERLERVYGAATYLGMQHSDQMVWRLRRLIESALTTAARAGSGPRSMPGAATRRAIPASA